MVGFAWSALKEASCGEHSEALLLVEYDLLTQKPEACLKLINEWLGEPWFGHDFDNVEYEEPKFDRQLGPPGLHAVKRKGRFEPRQTVLPPDLVQRFAPLAFWRDQAGSSAYQHHAERTAAGVAFGVEHDAERAPGLCRRVGDAQRAAEQPLLVLRSKAPSPRRAAPSVRRPRISLPSWRGDVAQE